MTWYLWTLLSMISGSFEQIIDKVVVIKNPAKIDVLIATFYRNFGFFFFTALAGVLGIFGHLSFVWNLPFLILALISPLHSLVYDYFLRTVELSRSQAVLYALPLFFVFIDKLFFGIAYSLPQLIGVMLLVFGALIFSFNEKQKKSAFSKKGLLGIALYGATSAYLLIAFKLYESTVNEISFYFSVWTLVIIFYVVLILATGKYKKLKETAVTEGFLKKTFASKGCDFLSSIFYLKALALATLTSVSAFSSFSPLVILIILLIIARFTKINVAEDFSRQTLPYKIIATAVLTIGGVLMFI